MKTIIYIMFMVLVCSVGFSAEFTEDFENGYGIFTDIQSRITTTQEIIDISYVFPTPYIIGQNDLFLSVIYNPVSAGYGAYGSGQGSFGFVNSAGLSNTLLDIMFWQQSYPYFTFYNGIVDDIFGFDCPVNQNYLAEIRIDKMGYMFFTVYNGISNTLPIVGYNVVYIGSFVDIAKITIRNNFYFANALQPNIIIDSIYFTDYQTTQNGPGNSGIGLGKGLGKTPNGNAFGIVNNPNR